MHFQQHSLTNVCMCMCSLCTHQEASKRPLRWPPQLTLQHPHRHVQRLLDFSTCAAWHTKSLSEVTRRTQAHTRMHTPQNCIQNLSINVFIICFATTEVTNVGKQGLWETIWFGFRHLCSNRAVAFEYFALCKYQNTNTLRVEQDYFSKHGW